MANKKPDITFFNLGASRSIRTAWVLEELNLPYKLETSARAPNGLAPPEFKQKIQAAGAPLGKCPSIIDGSVAIQESGAIADYLCETYDAECKSGLLPPTSNPQARAKVREWSAAAEGTFMLHALAILYARWRLPEAAKSHLPEMEKAMSPNVENDFKWLEGEISKGNGKYLVGDHLTIADIMMMFSIQFIFARKLGTEAGQWKAVDKYMEGLENEAGYKTAAEKTDFKL